MSQKLTTIDTQLLSRKKIYRKDTNSSMNHTWLSIFAATRTLMLLTVHCVFIFSMKCIDNCTLPGCFAADQPTNRKKNSISLYFFTLCKVVDSLYIFERQDTNTRWQTFLSQLMVRLRFFFLFMNFQKLKGKKSKNTEKKRQCHVMRHTE